MENNFNCIRTNDAITGTDRVALASKSLNYDLFINIQGDEPLLDPKDIEKCINLKQENPDYVFNGFNLMSSEENFNSPNIPKLVTNEHNDLIYISRALIPSQKKIINNKNLEYKKQVCIYGFSKQELNSFYNYGRKSKLEQIEDIEILRFFELNTPIKMFQCRKGSIAVDIPEDVKKVERFFQREIYNMNNYSHLFFDCDGVILNSNKIKTDAFYKLALNFWRIARTKISKLSSRKWWDFKI